MVQLTGYPNTLPEVNRFNMAGCH